MTTYIFPVTVLKVGDSKRNSMKYLFLRSLLPNETVIRKQLLKQIGTSAIDKI